MADLELECVNHPGRLTRVRCSSCGNPICVKCMRETPVGMKCPDCARQPLRVRYGKPRHYLGAAAAGLAVAAIAGALMGMIGFGIFISFLIGLGVAEVVHRVSGRQTLPVMRVLAVLVTVIGMSLGVLVMGTPAAALSSGRWLLTVGIAALGALVRLRA